MIDTLTYLTHCHTPDTDTTATPQILGLKQTVAAMAALEAALAGTKCELDLARWADVCRLDVIIV